MCHESNIKYLVCFRGIVFGVYGHLFAADQQTYDVAIKNLFGAMDKVGHCLRPNSLWSIRVMSNRPFIDRLILTCISHLYVM